MNHDNLVAAGLLALGMVISGWFIGHGFMEGTSTDRYVIDYFLED